MTCHPTWQCHCSHPRQSIHRGEGKAGYTTTNRTPGIAIPHGKVVAAVLGRTFSSAQEIAAGIEIAAAVNRQCMDSSCNLPTDPAANCGPGIPIPHRNIQTTIGFCAIASKLEESSSVEIVLGIKRQRMDVAIGASSQSDPNSPILRGDMITAVLGAALFARPHKVTAHVKIVAAIQSND